MIFVFRYKFKLADSAEVVPHVPLLNDRIYDNKFESQFYVISDTNKVCALMIFYLFYFYSLSLFVTFNFSKYGISDTFLQRVYGLGDVYPKLVKLPKGDYTVQFYIRCESFIIHANKMMYFHLLLYYFNNYLMLPVEIIEKMEG